MVEYSKVNVKLLNTQLNKLKDSVKNKTGTTLRINLKMLNGNNLPHELLLTARQKTKLRNALNNNTSTDIKLSKAQITKIIKSGDFLGSLLSKLARPLMKVAIPFAPLAIPLAIPFSSIRNSSSCFSNRCRNSKKIHGSGTKNLIISNEEMNDTIKIIQALEDSNILLKGVTKTIEMKQKNKKEDF